MVALVSKSSRAIFALCSLVTAQRGFADASADIGACLKKAGIEHSVPTTSTWVIDTQAWNSRVSPNPSAVVFPTTEKQVSAALKCAASSGAKVTTLGGNRSFSSMGFGRNDGALVINLKYMSHLKYDESTKLLSFGGNVTISEAAKYLLKYKRTTPHGRCADVGMTGVSASGFGTLSRAYGTALDNLVFARVAIANGSIVDASLRQNSDLFWAVRGAASSMGVVLDFKTKTYSFPSVSVTNYTIAFRKDAKPTIQDNVDALIGTQNWALSNDNNDFLSIRLSLKIKSLMEGFFYGSSIDAKKVLGSLMKRLPTSMVLTTTENSFWASENISTPTLFTNTAFAPKLPDASASGFVDIWGGKFTRGVRADDTAWKHDDNLLLIRWDMRSSAFDVPFAKSSITTMRKNFYKFVDAYKASGGVPGGFPTYRDELWTVAEMAKYLYGPNFPRLQKIKTKYDPYERFNADAQSIPALH
ncbi:unnamed protein product [Peronospora belbahrii]|uniref:FAD-binding PCMH-type domain-containing protein n=1 Tax=Peronospora belbahrii TaxID=622444 RepID=A0ABN8CVE3_9STRA|nr:unnamed protein product [Peronospora belbahrii]